jgi:hypothetical protein
MGHGPKYILFGVKHTHTPRRTHARLAMSIFALRSWEAISPGWVLRDTRAAQAVIKAREGRPDAVDHGFKPRAVNRVRRLRRIWEHLVKEQARFNLL